MGKLHVSASWHVISLQLVLGTKNKTKEMLQNKNKSTMHVIFPHTKQIAYKIAAYIRYK